VFLMGNGGNNVETKLNDLLERAIGIAVNAHQGQRDDSGEPYVLHPLRMMTRAKSVDAKIVAVLHDVVEDSDWTLDKLRAEAFSEAVVIAVDNLTKREGEQYDDFVTRSIRDPLSKEVKLLDLEDNMNVLRYKEVAEDERKRLAKYFKAWHQIMEG
jgi:(p)ppGpp synthase/HD superfamily hydrolase